MTRELLISNGLVPRRRDVLVTQCYSRLLSDLGLVSQCQPINQAKPSSHTRDACFAKLKARTRAFATKKKLSGKLFISGPAHSTSKKHWQEVMPAPVVIPQVLDTSPRGRAQVAPVLTVVSREIPVMRVVSSRVSPRIKGLVGVAAATILDPPESGSKRKRGVPGPILRQPANSAADTSPRGSVLLAPTSAVLSREIPVMKVVRVSPRTRGLAGLAAATIPAPPVSGSKRKRGACGSTLKQPPNSEAACPCVLPGLAKKARVQVSTTNLAREKCGQETRTVVPGQPCGGLIMRC